MSAYGVKGKCWVVFLNISDFAVGHKSQLNKSLEAVTDTESKTVTLVKKLLYCLADFRVTECCGNKLA